MKETTTEELPCEIACILCNISFLIGKSRSYQNILKHLLTEHKFVISNFQNVADPPKYFEHWRKKFQGHSSVADTCVIIKTNSGENDIEESEFYYLLSDTLPEDAVLRKDLQLKKLEAVLSQQEKERSNASFKRMCLFCRKVVEENRAVLLNHMAHDHNFSVGRPDNLVYVDELLDLLEEKLKGLQCLYCERTFKDWQTLKEHMRKKQHKQINPRNTAYDRFYIVNYMDPASKGAEKDMLVEAVDSEGEDVEWKDWEEQEATSMVCLFCVDARLSLEGIVKHMKEGHSFDLACVTKGLDFYQQIKVINYIRKQVYLRVCPVCSEKFLSHHEVTLHLSSSEHDNNCIDWALWDQPQYYFPTYENDQLLCALEDNCENSTDDEHVVPEDVAPPDRTVLRVLTGPEIEPEAAADH